MGFTWVDARYFDGLSAQRRQVFVSLDVKSQRLTIHDHLGADLDIWPLETLRQMRDDAGAGMVLCSGAVDPGEARVILANARAIAAIKAACPTSPKRQSPPEPGEKLWLGSGPAPQLLRSWFL